MPPAFTYHLKLGPQLLGIVNAYLTTALPLSLVHFSVAVPSSFDRLTEQSPDADCEANCRADVRLRHLAGGERGRRQRKRGDDKDEE